MSEIFAPMYPLRGLSAVVPLFNESENVAALVAELAETLDALPLPTEILLVDDGSTDSTFAEIEKARHQVPGIRVLRLAARSGQSAALVAGIRAAAMSHVATLDGDLQNDPRDLRVLVDGLSGADVVIGCRARRQDPPHRRWASRLANRLRRALLKDGVSDSACGLKLFPRRAFLALPPLDGMHRFLPVLFMRQGLVVEQRQVTHRPREAGRSKYTNLGRLLRTVPDLLGMYWLLRRWVDPRVLASRGPARVPEPEERTASGEVDVP